MRVIPDENFIKKINNEKLRKISKLILFPSGN